MRLATNSDQNREGAVLLYLSRRHRSRQLPFRELPRASVTRGESSRGYTVGVQDVSLFIGTVPQSPEPAQQFVVWGVMVVAALLALFVLVVLITAASRQGRRIKPEEDLRPERDLGPDPWIEAGRRLISNLGSSLGSQADNDETDVQSDPPGGTAIDPTDDIEFRGPDDPDPDDGDDDDGPPERPR